jgi:HEAT repeat protein
VPPALWAADGTPLPRSIVTFQVSGAVEAGRRVEPTDPELVAVDRPTLEAMAARDTAVWRRVFGLNWLAEQWPLESAEVLGQLASNAAEVSVVRNSALVNLGMNKAPAVVSIATAALLGSDQRGTRMSALTALGESGVPSAAGTVRPYILDAELGVSLRAIAAAGALKDADALPVLRQVLTDSSKRNRVDEVSAALASIGTPDAVVALLDLVRDRKTHDDVRIAVVRASAASRLIGVLPAVADVATDESDNKRVRTAAVRALADFGGGEALAGLRASLMSRESDVREAAVSSLVRTRDAAAVSEVIALVERSGSPLRETAIDSLATAGIRDSLPAIRRTAALQTNPVGIRRAAIRALGRLKDADAVPVLTSAANDSDRDTYQAVLTALAEIGADSMRPALTTALRSTHWQVRSQAARAIAERKFPETPALWQALLVERNDGAGSSIVTALIALGFAEPVAAPLVAGLDPAKNPLWFEHVRLLRHLTGQSIGPASESTGRQERTVELGRWRTWCASAPECR